MKTREAAATVKNAAKYLRMISKLVADKRAAKDMRVAAKALADVNASLTRKADRKERAVKVTGFAPQK